MKLDRNSPYAGEGVKVQRVGRVIMIIFFVLGIIAILLALFTEWADWTYSAGGASLIVVSILLLKELRKPFITYI